MPYLHQISAELWRDRIDLFWQIWITMTILSAIFVAKVVKHPDATPSISMAKGQAHLRKPWIGTLQGNSIIALTLMSLFLMMYVVTALVWEDFVYFDNVFFMGIPMKSISIPL